MYASYNNLKKEETKMKLLRDAKLYCIKVDYFMWSNEKQEEYNEPAYLSIDTKTKKKNGEPMNLLIFKEAITPHLRVFDTEREAKKYFKDHNIKFEEKSIINNMYYVINDRMRKRCKVS